MPLQVLPKESAMRADASARQIIEYLQIEQEQLGLQDSVVFYNFPLFREEEKLLVAELVVASPKHGVALISTAPNGISTDTQRLDGAFNQIFARLIKYPRLRIGRAVSNLKCNTRTKGNVRKWERDTSTCSQKTE